MVKSDPLNKAYSFSEFKIRVAHFSRQGYSAAIRIY